MQRLCLFLVLLSQLGCNHLFYQPDEFMYADIKMMVDRFEGGSLATTDGEYITYWDIPGKGPEKGVILQFHGNAENMTSHHLYVSWLTQHGYRVVTFDYRGYGRSTGSPSREGLVIDGKTILAHVCQKSRTPVVVVGQSLGGAVAVPAIAQWPQNCVCSLVLDSTFASYRDITRDKLGGFFLTWPFQYPLSYLVSDGESPVDYISDVKARVLSIHGLTDPVVGFHHGKALFDKAVDPDKVMWPLETEVPNHLEALTPNSPYRQKFLGYLETVTSQCLEKS